MKREIKILERLNHENIVKLYEAFDDQKSVYLINEYCGGGSLHTLLKQKQNRQLREYEARPLFKQIVSALKYCHQRHITHRDIKLENVLLNEE